MGAGIHPCSPAWEKASSLHRQTHTPLLPRGGEKCKTCYAIYTVGRAQHGEGMTSSREWSVVNLHSLCNPKALRKFVYVLLLSHSCNFLLHLKPARGEDFWKSSWLVLTWKGGWTETCCWKTSNERCLSEQLLNLNNVRNAEGKYVMTWEPSKLHKNQNNCPPQQNREGKKKKKKVSEVFFSCAFGTRKLHSVW